MVEFRLENGRNMQFWNNRWCGVDSLDNAFPKLLSIASTKDAQVYQMWEQLGEAGYWNLVFTRQNYD